MTRNAHDCSPYPVECATCGRKRSDFLLMMDVDSFGELSAFGGYMPRKLAALHTNEDIQRLVDEGLLERGCWGACDRMKGLRLTALGRQELDAVRHLLLPEE